MRLPGGVLVLLVLAAWMALAEGKAVNCCLAKYSKSGQMCSVDGSDAVGSSGLYTAYYVPVRPEGCPSCLVRSNIPNIFMI